MNLVILTGRLTRDIEMRVTNNNLHVADFSIAVKRETKEDMVDFVNIQAWRQNAEFLNNHAYKGTTISVQGKYREDKYVDRDGIDRRKVYILADRVEILNQPKEGRVKTAEDENKDFIQSVQGTPYAENFGGVTNVDLNDLSELDFY